MTKSVNGAQFALPAATREDPQPCQGSVFKFLEGGFGSSFQKSLQTSQSLIIKSFFSPSIKVPHVISGIKESRDSSA